MVGLARPFGQVLDLNVFHRNFGSKKSDLAIFFIEALFELLNIVERAGACSGLLRIIFLTRLVGTCGSRREPAGALLLWISLLIVRERAGTCGSVRGYAPDAVCLL